jgi:hypothetical protein
MSFCEGMGQPVGLKAALKENVEAWEETALVSHESFGFSPIFPALLMGCL